MLVQRIREKLFPKIQPFRKGFLDVGDGHEIYYEVCGNKKGIPVLYLHGGPGSGCDEDSRRFADPKKCRIILFDQRGSGRSRPHGGTNANTIWHLVDDVEKLLVELGIESVLLFGGSFGATFALVYSILHPERVRGMILRGIFLSESKELADYLEGQMERSHYPEVVERYLNNVPFYARKNPAEYYYAMMTSSDEESRKHFSYEWSYYETARIHLAPKSEGKVRKEILSEPYMACAIIEAHYFRNLCFLEDGFILKNAHRIPRVPISIIHGRHDDLCPVINAMRLHRALHGSKIHIVRAGHSRSDPEIRKKLVSETDAIISQLST